MSPTDLVRPQFPLAAAAGDVLSQNVMNQFMQSPYAQQMLGQFDAALRQVCAQGGAGQQRVYQPVAGGPAGGSPGGGGSCGGLGNCVEPWSPPGKDCGCGGKCGGGGGSCSGSTCPPQYLPPGKDPPPTWLPPGDNCHPIQPAGIPRGSVPLLQNLAPACYDCSCLDPCLYPALLFARNMFDPWQWVDATQNDGSLVHLDVNAGAAADFNVPLFPIAANTESLFAQQAEQVLPYIAGLIKVDVAWSNGPAPGAVTIQFYTGPNPTATNVTIAQLEAQGGVFAKAGRAYKLTDFECKDQCYVQPFVKIFQCTPGPIPYSRAVYARVTAGALPGNTTITSITITLIKQGTPQYVNCCSDFRIPQVGLGCGKVRMGVEAAQTACNMMPTMW